MRYSASQTSLIDLFLAELSRLSDGHSTIINFNNTRQFDALLSHLELSFLEHSIAVPSVSTLEIILTLAARCPTSNWTHAAQIEGITSTDYMKLVNADYDATLFKTLLQQRSLGILRKYIDVLTDFDPKYHNLKGRDMEMIRLFANMETMFSKFCKSNDSPFPRTASVSVEPESEMVISDSEGSEKLLLDPTAFRRVKLPMRGISSLADVGSRISGLGETTQLFKDMPHLLAHATPEPEESARPKKKPKYEVDPLSRLQVYDDFLLSKKLSAHESYTLWSLLRWTFQCADNSTQYQRAGLFQSSQTSVHSIYESYEGVLTLLFDFLSIQRLNTSHTDLFTKLLSQLGRKQDWCERAVELVFSGLSIPTQDKPYPCFARESVLIKHDPNVHSTQRQTMVGCDDNQDSLRLRFQIICLLYTREVAELKKVDSTVREDDTSDKNGLQTFLELLVKKAEKKKKKGVKNLLQHVAAKLAQIKFEYLVGLFECAFPDRSNTFMIDLSNTILCQATSLKTRASYKAHDDTHKKVRSISNFLSSDFYSSITDDVTYKTFAEFESKWNRVLFVARWLLTHALTELRVDWEQTTEDVEVLGLAKEASIGADKLVLAHYAAYVDSKTEQSEDANFVLDVATAEQLKQRVSPSFAEVVTLVAYTKIA